jgi:hypothetical protein
MRRRTVLGGLLLATLTAGCSSLQTVVAGAPPQVFMLSPKSTFSPDLPHVRWQLIIEEPTAAGGLDTVRLALQPQPLQIEYFGGARWAERAPRMIQTLAIESFENLHSRFDECRYTPESFYQLYRIYKEKEEVENFFSLDGSGSEMYANIIFERFPNSEFARLIRDPNVLEADAARRLEEEAAYQRLYGRFRIHAYREVINESNRVIREEPQNHFRAKYYLLKAMAVGGMRSVEAFRTALEEVKEHVPGTDEAKAAEELLAALARAEGAQAEAETKKSAPPPAFRPEQGQHYFALVVPNAGNDMNEIKGKIADFNKAYFRNVSIQITNSFLDSKHQVVLLSVFESRKKAMEYYDTFLADTNKLQGINDQQWASFAISPDNYSQLYKSKDVDGYTAFFTKNYLERQ